MSVINRIKQLTDRITMSVFGTDFTLRVERDTQHKPGRIFLQVIYSAPCTRTSLITEWHGRKWYLSDYMTNDEIIKTAYTAFEAAVKHEVMEGFKVDDTILFNPHINFEELLKVSHKEIKRAEMI